MRARISGTSRHVGSEVEHGVGLLGGVLGQIVAQGVRSRGRPTRGALHADFAVDIGDMALYRAHAQHQQRRDALVVLASCDQPQHLNLAVRKMVRERCSGRVWR